MKERSEFSISKWEELKCGEPENNMLTARASVIYEMTGEIKGKLNVEYLLHYTNYDVSNQHNSEATYIGYITFVGSLNGKFGTFVLEDKGIYSSAGPVSELVIKPNTGTNDYKGISGTGKYFTEDGKMIFEIEYQI